MTSLCLHYCLPNIKLVILCQCAAADAVAHTHATGVFAHLLTSACALNAPKQEHCSDGKKYATSATTSGCYSSRPLKCTVKANNASVIDFVGLTHDGGPVVYTAGLPWSANTVPLDCDLADCVCPNAYPTGIVLSESSIPGRQYLVMGSAGGPRFDVFGLDIMLWAGSCAPDNKKSGQVAIIGERASESCVRASPRTLLAWRRPEHCEPAVSHPSPP